MADRHDDPNTHEFDQDYWERHWQQAHRTGHAAGDASAPNPYLSRETGGLVPGTALDAGCGAGARQSGSWRASGASEGGPARSVTSQPVRSAKRRRRSAAISAAPRSVPA